MTRLLTCGWETGDINEAGSVSVIASFSTLEANSSNPTPRTPGNYCLRAAYPGGTMDTTYRAFPLPASKTEVWVRFSFLSNMSSSSNLGIAVLEDSSGAAQTSLYYNHSDKFLRVYSGNGSTLLATSSATLLANTWYTIDWRTLISTATTGASEVWIDGVQAINFSGDNSATSTLNVATLKLGQVAAAGFSNGGGHFGFDDLAINDTAGSINNARIGDGRIVLLKPNGAGTNADQTRGGTDSGANWSQVDDFPPSMSDYVYASTAAARDTYALQDVPSGSWTVNAVEVLSYAQNSTSGSGSLGLTVKSGATTNEGTAQSLAASSQYVRQLYETDPNTGVAWTVAAVNALEAGTTVR